MKPAKSGLSQIGAKVGMLAMLAGAAAYVLSHEPAAPLIFLVLASGLQLLCLVEGPWTAPLAQRVSIRHRAARSK